METLQRFCEDNFPFYIEVDRGLRVQSLGASAQRLLHTAAHGQPFATLCRIRGTAPQPSTVEQIVQERGRSVILDCVQGTQAVLRGTWYQPGGSDTLLFLGWPWVLDSEELSNLGLSLHDFPAHTPLSDMLILLRTSQNTLADSRALSVRLRERTNALKATNAQLEQLAHFDALTKMPNRVLLGDRLRQAMLQCERRGTCLALAYIDLDGFKVINDTHGHEAGDQFLAVLAQCLKDVLREQDTLARLGGDEFVVVLSDLQTPNDSAPVLERLLEAARSRVTVGNVVLQVSASLGVTYSPQDAADADLLLRHADQAMYVAKQSGKNHWHAFDYTNDAAVATRHENLEAIRRGIDSGEFVQHYQPLVEFSTQRVLGVEALVRWARPEFGLLAPAVFLPQIISHPLGIKLGQWVLRSALQQLEFWNAQGLNLGVSVNLDPNHLLSDNFTASLKLLLQEHPGVRPQQLTLEVLESSALEDIERAQKVREQCHLLGIRCALDDFGTGYSGLSHLSKLGVDTLKIDRSFVADMLVNPNNRTVVQAVISLARAFDCSVVAEGVESMEHAHALVSMGCGVMQGFGIARPMPAAEVIQWVQDFSRIQTPTGDQG